MAYGINQHGAVVLMAAEKMSTDVFERASQWIRQYQKTLGYLPEEELKMWEYLLNYHQISGNERIKVEQNIANLREQIGRKEIERTRLKLEEQLELNEITAGQEIEVWKRVAESHEEGTTLRLKAEEILASRREQLNRDKIQALEEMQRLEQRYF